MTIRRWVESGRLRGELIGDRVLVEEADVAALERPPSGHARKAESAVHGKRRRG